MRGVASAEDADFDARVAAMKTWRLRALFVCVSCDRASRSSQGRYFGFRIAWQS